MQIEAAEKYVLKMVDVSDCRPFHREREFKVLNRFIDRKGVEKTAMIVPIVFCTMWYIKNSIYPLTNKASNTMRIPHSARIVIPFLKMLSPRNLSELRLLEFIENKAISSNDREEELYVSYGGELTYRNVWSSR